MLLEDQRAPRPASSTRASRPCLGSQALPPARSFYVVGGGWRALARIRLAMTDTPLKVVHDYRLSADEAMHAGPQHRRAGRGGTADGAGHARPAASRPCVPRRCCSSGWCAGSSPSRVVFSAFGLREGRAVRAALGRTSWPRIRSSPEPGISAAAARGCPKSAVPWANGPHLSPPARTSSSGGCGWPSARSPTAPGVSIRHSARAKLSIAWRSIRSSGSTTRSARSSPMPCSSATRAAQRICSSGRSCSLLPEAERRRAELLGATLQLGYRISAAVPDLLETSRL